MDDIVIGAGALGRHTAQALLDRGHDVAVVSRSGRAPVRGVTAKQADARDAAALTRALAGASRVYQCAQPAYHRWSQEFPALQSTILQAAGAVGADVIICDNLYGYGRPSGVISESAPESPATRKGELRRRMAADALAAHASGRLRVTLLRPSNYFGPGYRSDDDLFRPALEGRRMRILGREDAPHSFTYLPDAGRAMAALGSHEGAWGRAWIAPVQPALTQRAFVDAIWRAAGQEGSAPVAALRRRGAQLLGLFSPLVRELAEMMYEFEEPFVVDSRAIQHELGVHPTPLDDAVRESLAAVREAQPSRRP